MSEKEIQNVLEELNNVRPEILTEEAKRLFETIMRIADSRDYYKKKEKQDYIRNTRDCDEEFEL